VYLAPEHLGIILVGLAGAFVAIGAGHLLPEAQHRRGINVSPLVAMTVLGAAVVVVTRLLIGEKRDQKCPP
jgi:zinc transporter ZupT